ncbi:putative quinol monooxygenase [Mycolicibacterium aichiense]|uniref:Antibiotic biosynthesis monooxygenase n=1 Tax=Mycolicibacterium aichiense TaxID=1799 RepID=A0AAD1HPS4_9MYCO|nr:antibiotic biosynthesis monooxygenase family protein [Mycolicibacterium aichiense]MCV7016817.1 antibiotic biosynthesis monooxygenase [Mycolicibacterium aichiense]BBX09397.1 antibiotic biosynthesis monooxygenase [Mycolicibacterium aichiense]SUA13963.1 Putative monooxygenase ycnE [Mycolicibacterium aichiense]
MDASVVVIAHWRTTEADLDAVLERTATLRRLSLAEPGCLGYDAYHSTEEPTSLVIVERYRDVAAQQAHLDSAHYQELVADGIRPLLVARNVEILQVRELD